MALDKVQVNDMSKEDLLTKLTDYQARYTKAKFGHTVTPLLNPNELKYMRRDIARIKTALRKLDLKK